jgi:hypothetical protein
MDIQYNSHCYTFEEKRYDAPILDGIADVTYIIHLENNGRKSHVEDQLSKYQPTNRVFIVHNEGYKNCEKKLIDQAPYQDLTDAFLQCFRHADENDYENILILEDDFIFSPEMKNAKTIHAIAEFFKNQRDREFIYYLGCIPICIFPYNVSHYYSIKSLTAHAIIYSKQARKKHIDTHYKHWDVILEKNFPNRYLYCHPLCYQLFPETENKKTWAEKDSVIISWLKDRMIQTLHLDKEAEWGFAIIYYFAKLLFLLLLCMVLLTLSFVVRLFYKNTKQTKRNYKITK